MQKIEAQPDLPTQEATETPKAAPIQASIWHHGTLWVLKEMLKFVSTEATRPQLGGLGVKDGQMVACDGHRLISVPLEALGFVLADGSYSLALTGKGKGQSGLLAQRLESDGAIYSLPNYSAVIPTMEGKEHFSVNMGGGRKDSRAFTALVYQLNKRGLVVDLRLLESLPEGSWEVYYTPGKDGKQPESGILFRHDFYGAPLTVVMMPCRIA